MEVRSLCAGKGRRAKSSFGEVRRLPPSYAPSRPQRDLRELLAEVETVEEFVELLEGRYHCESMPSRPTNGESAQVSTEVLVHFAHRPSLASLAFDDPTGVLFDNGDDLTEP